jgi:hypothetical protein
MKKVKKKSEIQAKMKYNKESEVPLSVRGWSTTWSVTGSLTVRHWSVPKLSPVHLWAVIGPWMVDELGDA